MARLEIAAPNDAVDGTEPVSIAAVKQGVVIRPRLTFNDTYVAHVGVGAWVFSLCCRITIHE